MHKKEAQLDKELKKKIHTLLQQLEHKEQEIATLKRENKQFIKKTDSNLSSFFELKNDFDKLLENIKEQNEKCKDCDRIDLLQRSVLVVGGITKMESFYRKLIQDLGGNFYYHDGYCHQDESVIDNLVKQSDIVICPVDVNSHAACLQVKKACKKNGINYYMLRKSSISSVYNTLREVATG